MNRATSIYLDFIRFLAAITVFLVHARYERFTSGLPMIWRMGEFGNDAVMVFFVLSGFVIAYVSDKKEKTLKEYSASRFARLYSVAAPALVLTIVLDFIGSHIDYSLYNGWWFQSDHPIWRIAANLFFINELWFSSVRLFSNGPYWSLGYEFWYYVIFAVVWYLKHPLRYLLVAAICLLIGPKILILFPIWLLGVWAYFKIKSRPVAEPLGWAMFVGSVATYVVFRMGGYPQLLDEWSMNILGTQFVQEKLSWSQFFLSSYVIGPLVALNFVGVAAVGHRIEKFLRFFEGPIRYLGGYTFALYLFHYPLLQFFAAVSSTVAQPLLRGAIVLGGTLSVIWVLGTITERRKSDVKRLFLSTYDAIAPKALPSTKG